MTTGYHNSSGKIPPARGTYQRSELTCRIFPGLERLNWLAANIQNFTCGLSCHQDARRMNHLVRVLAKMSEWISMHGMVKIVQLAMLAKLYESFHGKSVVYLIFIAVHVA